MSAKRYIAVPKRQYLARLHGYALAADAKQPGFLSWLWQNKADLPAKWQAGATDLDKTAVGKIITAPIELPSKILTATGQTVEQVPGIVGSLKSVVPIAAAVAGIAAIGFIYFKVKSRQKGNL
jgi:hypothetical protein